MKFFSIIHCMIICQIIRWYISILLKKKTKAPTFFSSLSHFYSCNFVIQVIKKKKSKNPNLVVWFIVPIVSPPLYICNLQFSLSKVRVVVTRCYCVRTICRQSCCYCNSTLHWADVIIEVINLLLLPSCAPPWYCKWCTTVVGRSGLIELSSSLYSFLGSFMLM